jgi:hypothetical protein
MNRRAALRSIGAAFGTVGAGCLGGGGEIIVSVQRSVTIEPGRAWIKKDIPDISDSGGGIEYIVRSESPFDVYFFAGEDSFEHYDAYLGGYDPEETPSGHREISQTSTKTGSEAHEATSSNNGNRQPIDVEGPYYFAVDHSSYRMETRVEEFDDPLNPVIDLKIIRDRSPL